MKNKKRIKNLEQRVANLELIVAKKLVKDSVEIPDLSVSGQVAPDGTWRYNTIIDDIKRNNQINEVFRNVL